LIGSKTPIDGGARLANAYMVGVIARLMLYMTHLAEGFEAVG
jgi:hypothetical protein